MNPRNPNTGLPITPDSPSEANTVPLCHYCGVEVDNYVIVKNGTRSFHLDCFISHSGYEDNEDKDDYEELED